MDGAAWSIVEQFGAGVLWSSVKQCGAVKSAEQCGTVWSTVEQCRASDPIRSDKLYDIYDA
jgi:hypothetical protein